MKMPAIRILSIPLLAIALLASTGIVSGEGYGGSKPAACMAAKKEGQGKISLAAISKPGGAANVRVTRFDSCDCEENKASANLTTRWHCTVDVYWSNEK